MARLASASSRSSSEEPTTTISVPLVGLDRRGEQPRPALDPRHDLALDERRRLRRRAASSAGSRTARPRRAGASSRRPRRPGSRIWAKLSSCSTSGSASEPREPASGAARPAPRPRSPGSAAPSSSDSSSCVAEAQVDEQADARRAPPPSRPRTPASRAAGSAAGSCAGRPRAGGSRRRARSRSSRCRTACRSSGAGSGRRSRRRWSGSRSRSPRRARAARSARAPRPGRRMNVSSIANSFAESAISVSPRQTRRVAGSRRRSPTAQLGRALGRAAPDQRAQPGEQLRERERLGQVVVGAAVEPATRSRTRVARGQHQDRRPDAGVAQPPADLEAVDARQHHVEHDRVVLGRPAIQSASSPLIATSAAIPSPINRAGSGRHLHLVLDDQHTHRTPSLSAKMKAR